MKTLGIISPNLGAVSETFVKRHIEELWPQKTVLVSCSSKKPYAGYWSVECPTLALDQLPKASPYKVFNYLHSLFEMAPANRWYALPVVSDFLRLHQVDVIMGEYLSYSFPFFKIAQKLNIPYFAHAHGADVSVNLRELKWQKRYRFYNQCAGIIVVSHSSKERLIDIGIYPEKVHIIPCGVDVSEQPILREENCDEIVCLAVGRMVPKKAPLVLLEAFRQAVKIIPELKLIYIGDGPLMTEVQSFLNRFSLQNKVRLYGSQPPDFVLGQMRLADIFVQHSMIDPVSGDAEGLPVSLLEAMAQALPVVSTRHEGIIDAVIEHQTGLLVDEGDADGMAHGLIALASNYSKRRQMGIAGWHRVKDSFSWQKEKKDLLELMHLV